MAELIFDAYMGETEYTDGEQFESRMLELAKGGESDKESLFSESWPILYHFSPLRENILNWYPFKKDCSIIEIGSGCGAITGLLCEKAKNVISLELTKARASINYERHKDYANLKIMAGNLENICIETKCDYAIVNGVFEYAGLFISDDNPYKRFLELVSSFLKDEGVILLAIENRLGLKYFSGAREDHLGVFFAGLNGYRDEKVRTFSKEELNEEISKAGLYTLKYYYPYPDYKFPFEVFTEASVNTIVPSARDLPFDANRALLFDNMAVYRSLMREKTMDKFSNSFLIEISKSSKVESTKIEYAKMSTNRKKQFQIITYYNEDKAMVYKKAIYSEGETHIERMKSFGGYNKNCFINIPCFEKGNKIIAFPYIDNKSLDTVLYDSYKKGLDYFIGQVSNFRDVLYSGTALTNDFYTEDFKAIFGTKTCCSALHCVENANVDIIANNVFFEGDIYKVIDYEWHLPCKAPAEYILWRMLRQFIDNHSLYEQISKSTYLQIIGINETSEECFFSWEQHFAYDYVGMKNLDYYAKDIVQIDLNEVVKAKLEERVLLSTLFFDLGGGFTELNRCQVRAEYTPTEWIVSFRGDQIQQAKRLRWDPIDGYPCELSIKRIETDAINLKISPLNDEKIDNADCDVFYTFDPQYMLTGDFSVATFLSIAFSLKTLDWRTGYIKREKELSNSRQENQMLNGQLHETRQENQMLNGQLHETQELLKNKLSEIEHIKKYANSYRIKAAVKVLIYGDIDGRKKQS